MFKAEKIEYILPKIRNKARCQLDFYQFVVEVLANAIMK